jgi:hypothetical protein
MANPGQTDKIRHRGAMLGQNFAEGYGFPGIRFPPKHQGRAAELGQQVFRQWPLGILNKGEKHIRSSRILGRSQDALHQFICYDIKITINLLQYLTNGAGVRQALKEKVAQGLKTEDLLEQRSAPLTIPR